MFIKPFSVTEFGFTCVMLAGAVWILSWAFLTVMAALHGWPGRQRY